MTHGTLHVASPGEGLGATFTLRLPLGEPPITPPTGTAAVTPLP